MPLYNQSGYGSGKYGIADGGPIYSLPMGYYLNLLTSEYRPTPLFNAWLDDLLTPLDDITTCIATFNEAFDLDTAIGAQLDILGSILGQARRVNFQPSGGASAILIDSDYRTLLIAKQALNQWDGRQPSLQPIWQNLFPGGKIIIDDQQNMTAIVVMSGVFTAIIQDCIANGLVIPRPETVEYTYAFSDLPLFGFDQDNSFVAGFDKGHFV